MSGRPGSGRARAARMFAGPPPAGGSALIAGIVLALLLIAAAFVALLYGAGELRDGPLNVTEFGSPEALFGEPPANP